MFGVESIWHSRFVSGTTEGEPWQAGPARALVRYPLDRFVRWRFEFVAAEPDEARDGSTWLRDRRIVVYVLGLGLLVTLGSPQATATTFTVTVGDGGFIFSPDSVTIQLGDTVQWTWSSTGHISTSGSPGSPSGLWDSGILNQGATFSHTFNAAGSFPY